MFQAERFIHEIQADELLDRINHLHDMRVVQLDDAKTKPYQTHARRLNLLYRQLVTTGPTRTIATPREQALLDKQQHYGFDELSPQEQRQLRGEIDSMWAQIPEHLQKKARDLAGVN